MNRRCCRPCLRELQRYAASKNGLNRLADHPLYMRLRSVEVRLLPEAITESLAGVAKIAVRGSHRGRPKNKELLLFFRQESEPANVSATSHAFLLLDLAIGESFHQAPVQVADLSIPYRHSMKHAIIGFNYRFTTG